MPSGQVFVDLHHVDCDEFEAASFQPGYDIPDEAALHAVGFDSDEGTFH
jgi:hypothetical protein